MTVTAGSTPNHMGNALIYTCTSSTDDNEVPIQTGDVSQYDAFMVMSTAGALDVFVSLDGTNYSTAALSLVDFGATDTAPVIVTVANRVYGFRGKYRLIRVLQNGATDTANVTLICGTM